LRRFENVILQRKNVSFFLCEEWNFLIFFKVTPTLKPPTPLKAVQMDGLFVNAPSRPYLSKLIIVKKKQQKDDCGFIADVRQ